MNKDQTLTALQSIELIGKLQKRFEKSANRHPELNWTDVLQRIEKSPEKLWSLFQMEQTGGEPDVIGQNPESGEIIFCDCSAESPAGRRSLCYDREALESRKEHRPSDSVLDLAASMGIELLSEKQYRELQEIGIFDTKTSNWIKTPDEIRKLGGALFVDRRYNHVFVYHNGAESYYAARGFRGRLEI